MTSKNSCFDRAIFRRSLRRTAPVWGLFCLYELLLPLRLYSYCRGVSVCTEDFFVQAERTILENAVTGASVVPSLCRATFDRRTLVGEDEAVILGQVNEAIARAQETHPGLKARCYLAEGEEKCWTGDTIRARRYFPAWVTEEDSELVQTALKGLKDAGIEAPLSHFSFCTNGSSFCGEAGIPTIGYGPSLESLAHVRDEYIEIDQLLKSCKGFESILTQLTR